MSLIDTATSDLVVLKALKEEYAAWKDMTLF